MSLVFRGYRGSVAKTTEDVRFAGASTVVLVPVTGAEGVEALETALLGSGNSTVIIFVGTGITVNEAVMLAGGASVVAKAAELASVNSIIVALVATGSCVPRAAVFAGGSVVVKAAVDSIIMGAVPSVEMSGKAVSGNGS